jgi:hypothetical protein
MTPIRTTLATVLIALLFAASCSDEDLTWEDPIVKQAPCDPELESCLGTPVEDIPVEDMGWRPGSDDSPRLNSPDYEYYQPRSEPDPDEPRREPVPANTDVLLDLPWREAQQIAHDAGWHTEMYFPEGDEPMAWTLDLKWNRLRIVVTGGEETGTVSSVSEG